MNPIDYDRAGFAVRDDFARAHTRFWARLARPGAWWTGAERVDIAREVRAARECTLCAARKAALAGAIPVPGADMTAVTAIQVQLISDIAAAFDQKVTQDVALFIMGEALAGAGRSFARWTASALKAAGWLPGGQLGEVAATALGASIASASTYGVGRAAILYMQRLQEGRALSAVEVREVFDRFALAWKDGRVDPPDGAIGPVGADRILDLPTDPAGDDP